MRKLWVAALIALLAIAFFLLIPQAGAGTAARATNAPGSDFGIYSSEMADYGNSSVAVLRMYLFSNGTGTVSVFCSEKPVQKNMLILDHSVAPGVDRALSGYLENSLEECGLSSRHAGTDDAASSQNAVILSPTGAVPSELAAENTSLSDANDRVIVLQSLPGRVVDAQGALSDGAMPDSFEAVNLEPGSELQDAQEAARAALFVPMAATQQTSAQQGNFTIIVPANFSLSYCRAVYIGDSGACRFADSGSVMAPPGRLSGPQQTLAGQEAVFEFGLANGTEFGRRLQFFASTFAGQGEEARVQIAGGEILGGFASRFALNFSSGGQYVVHIIDQFGRLHAAAYVEAEGLQVIPVQQQGTRYEYRVLFGGEPATGDIAAWIDSGEPKTYSVSGGTLVIWAQPSEGSHVMHFEYQGLEAQSGFSAQGGGLADTYIRLGVPALIFLFAVFFLLRAGRKAKYSITFPHFADMPPRVMETSYAELCDAWELADRKLGGHSLVAYPEEIAGALLQMKREKEKSSISAHSALRLLRSLAKQGKFAESGGKFIPASKLGGFTAGELSELRLIHDLLLERGVPFVRSRKVPVEREGLELVIYSGKRLVLSGMGNSRRAIVFETRQLLEEFEAGLSDSEREDVRIKIAISNGKLTLVGASRAELEGILL